MSFGRPESCCWPETEEDCSALLLFDGDDSASAELTFVNPLFAGLLWAIAYVVLEATQFVYFGGLFQGGIRGG